MIVLVEVTEYVLWPPINTIWLPLMREGMGGYSSILVVTTVTTRGG
ncbi:hypothetical protein [Pyrococcus kukulkanii]